MEAALKKQNGVHYTPPKLAAFLASQTIECLPKRLPSRISILDPACGDGGLLSALAKVIRERSSTTRLDIVGYELDSDAAEQSRQRLKKESLGRLEIRNEDFLASEDVEDSFDVVIANPPYVRTQVLGGAESQRLANKFGLTGRVDLYHAFAVAIHKALKPTGSLGLLTSNRFLTVKSGAAMRRLLAGNFELNSVTDLGDSRLFKAAVLPVVVTGNKKKKDHATIALENERNTTFTRVSRTVEIDGQANEQRLTGQPESPSLLDLVAQRTGDVLADEGRFRIEKGNLIAEKPDGTWSLSTPDTRQWISTISNHTKHSFGDLAQIKVGIKTTADSVFIREDWNETPNRPEANLLVPLITHHDAKRWTIAGADSTTTTRKTVLYPYEFLHDSDCQSKARTAREPISLSRFPKAKTYLSSHRDRLEGRKYVIDAGRKWYEIWVPHQPSNWKKPKIVWPDISEEPRFFLDSSGAIVNGDCYWIKLREGVDSDWLYLMLAVANSTIATKFYDTMFHNKLYAGRRRFMTQYVKEFPLPDLDSRIGKQIVRATKRLVQKPTATGEKSVQRMVSKAFGFTG
jgi:methylase of polypeptide subunit release factors